MSDAANLSRYDCFAEMVSEYGLIVRGMRLLGDTRSAIGKAMGFETIEAPDQRE